MRADAYNNYPEGFLEEFKEPVVFRLINIKPDPDNEGAFIMPNITAVPSESQVICDGEVVHLALISTVDPEGNATLDSRSLWLGQINGGEIRLDPKRAKDHKIFKYLNHCHWNRSSKYASDNPADWIVFKFDPETQAKEELAEKNPMMESISFITSASDAALRKLHVIIGDGSPKGKSVDVIKNELIKIATSVPDKAYAGIQAITPSLGKGDVKNADKESTPTIEVDSENIPEDLDVEAVAREAEKTKVIVRVNRYQVYRDQEGNDFFKFKSKEEAGATASEQLVDALDSDPDLLAKLQHMMS